MEGRSCVEGGDSDSEQGGGGSGAEGCASSAAERNDGGRTSGELWLDGTARPPTQSTPTSGDSVKSLVGFLARLDFDT